jgi:hypothetical protein
MRKTERRHQTCAEEEIETNYEAWSENTELGIPFLFHNELMIFPPGEGRGLESESEFGPRVAACCALFVRESMQPDEDPADSLANYGS